MNIVFPVLHGPLGEYEIIEKLQKNYIVSFIGPRSIMAQCLRASIVGMRCEPLIDFFIEITDEEWKWIDFVIRHLKLHFVVGYLQRLLQILNNLSCDKFPTTKVLFLERNVNYIQFIVCCGFFL